MLWKQQKSCKNIIYACEHIQHYCFSCCFFLCKNVHNGTKIWLEDYLVTEMHKNVDYGKKALKCPQWSWNSVFHSPNQFWFSVHFTKHSSCNTLEDIFKSLGLRLLMPHHLLCWGQNYISLGNKLANKLYHSAQNRLLDLLLMFSSLSYKSPPTTLTSLICTHYVAFFPSLIIQI